MHTDTAQLAHRRLRTTHSGDLCVDHLDVPFDQRDALEQTIRAVRRQLAEAQDAGQWVFNHLSELRIRHSLHDEPPPHPFVRTAAFLVQPWSQTWRWARLTHPTASHPGAVDNLRTTTDVVLEQVAPSSRGELLRLISEADDVVLDTHLQVVDRQQRASQQFRPAVVHIRRLGASEDPLLIGVWVIATDQS